MIAFCLGKAHSATSDLSLLLGALTIILLGLRFVNKQFVGVYAVAAIIALIIAQITFDFYGNVVDLSWPRKYHRRPRSSLGVSSGEQRKSHPGNRI